MGTSGSKHRRWVAFIAFIAIVIIALYSLAYIGGGVAWALLQESDTELWDIDQTEQYVGADIPDNATNIQLYAGEFGKLIRPHIVIELSFESPPQEAMKFAQAICIEIDHAIANGILHAGYDPFRAVDIAEPFTFATYIKHNVARMYYSYSENTPDTMLGNRCQHRSTYAAHQVSVDQSDPNLYRAEYLYPANCSIWDCQVAANIVNPYPNTPVNLLGVEVIHETYFVKAREICIGLQKWRFTNPSDTWDQFLGGKFEWFLANNQIGSAYIADEGTLSPRYEATGRYISVEESGNSSYYCLAADWGTGDHIMGILLTAVDGREFSSNWKITISN